MLIKPTVGRVVWFYPLGKTQVDAGEQPQAAIVAYVFHDRMVNLMAVNANGISYSQTSVQLVQEGDELPAHGFCSWMPYQKSQQAKTEALERQAAGQLGGHAALTCCRPAPAQRA